jgi:hypothetical protein
VLRERGTVAAGSEYGFVHRVNSARVVGIPADPA